MKICIVTQQVIKGNGQGRVNYEIVWEAVRQNYHVTLLATNVAQELLDQTSQIRWIPIHVNQGIPQLFNDWSFAQQTTQWLTLNRSALDLVIVNGGITWAVGTVNIVHFVHSAWLRSPFHASRVRKDLYGIYHWLYSTLHSRWERKVCQQVKTVVAVSAKVRQDLETIGVSEKQIRVIVNGVNLQEFSPGHANRHTWGLPPDQPLAFFAGDIGNPRKNMDTILQALVHVPNLHLAVLGSPENSPYPELASKLGIQDRVYFLGYRSDIPELMRTSDLLVFPSRYEACTLVLLEAMASGLPIITATSTGGAELVTPDAGIVLSDPNDINALAESLEKLANTPSLRQHMSSASRAIAEQHSWANMAQSYIALFEELHQSRKQGA